MHSGNDGIEEKRKELLAKLEEINGKTVEEIDTTHWMDKETSKNNKGVIGEVVQIYLGKDPDSDPDRDFPEADVELKATGLVELKSKKKNAFKAKERLVLTMINYKEDHGVGFEQSHVLSKCHALLITCYDYQYDKDGKPKDYRQFPFIESFIYELSGEDRRMIEEDYNVILGKINEGRAEAISESDTHYLEACPKGKNKEDTVEQYGSDVKAMRRAFAFKPSFINAIIRQHISNETYESVLAGVGSHIRKETIEELIKKRIAPYIGRKSSELFRAFGVNASDKGAYAVLISRIVGKKDLQATEEFQKANIHIKTIRVEKNGSIKEQMSFSPFNFYTLAFTPWDESEWQAYFNGAEFMIPVFRDRKGDKDYILDDVVFYKIPDIVSEGFIRYTYEKTQKTLLSGDVVNHVEYNKNGKRIHKTNFVGMSENPICHIRPHGQNFAKSQRPIPVKDKVTRSDTYAAQCLWLGSKYIEAIIKGNGHEFECKACEKMKKEGHKLPYDL